MASGVLAAEKIGVSNVFEAMGKVYAGKMNANELKTLENAACPGCGSCNGMFTANTMACLTEALGMSLPNCATALAATAAKVRIAKETGEKIVQLVSKDLKPYLGQTGATRLYKADTGTDDNGTGYAGWFNTGLLKLADEGVSNSFRKFIVDLNTEETKNFQARITLYNVAATQSLDLVAGDTGVILDQFMLDQDFLSGPEYGQIWHRMGGRARYAQVELRTTATAQDLDIYGFGFSRIPRPFHKPVR